MTRLENQLIYHEGIRLMPYKCPEGKLTIGVGRNIEDRGISKEEAIYMLENDVNDCISDLINIFPDFEQFTQGRRIAMIDLRFNIGPGGFRTFKKMIAAIKDRDWNAAAMELIDSKWWDQVQSVRRNTLHRQLLTGNT